MVTMKKIWALVKSAFHGHIVSMKVVLKENQFALTVNHGNLNDGGIILSEQVEMVVYYFPVKVVVLYLIPKLYHEKR